MTAPSPQDDEKLFLPDSEPEPVSVQLRAVCGFLIGLVFASVAWLQMRDLGQAWTILLFTTVPVGLAWCAAKWEMDSGRM